jgi:predicted nucleic acid-binding protein
MLIATALENNCEILYSEDLQHGQIIENKQA